MEQGHSVLIIGGGIAGLTAAHELKDRGFQVTVYEREETFGGKARSFPVPDDVRIKKIRNLPGEHGFRFFPRFLQASGRNASPYSMRAGHIRVQQSNRSRTRGLCAGGKGLLPLSNETAEGG